MAKKKDVQIVNQDSEYESFVKRFADLVVTTARQLADNAYQLGLMCIELQERADQYGSRDLGQLADQISARTGVKMGRSQLYDMKAFAEKVRPEQVERLKDVGLPWRALRLLGRASLTDQSRATLVDEIVTGKLPPGEIEAEVRSRTGGGGGGPSAAVPYKQQLRALDGLPDLLTLTVRKVRAYEEAAVEIIEGDDEAAMRLAISSFPKMQEAVDGAAVVLREMVDRLAPRLKKLEKGLS